MRNWARPDPKTEAEALVTDINKELISPWLHVPVVQPEVILFLDPQMFVTGVVQQPVKPPACLKKYKQHQSNIGVWCTGVLIDFKITRVELQISFGPD